MTTDNKLTNAGVLFFAQDIDFLLNHAIVVCALYQGTDKVHILDKKDFKSGLVDNIDNAMLFIQRHTNVRFKIEHLRREEIPDYPEVALREALVNAVCHRDYFDKRSNVLVEVFVDRIQISNPGGLPSGLSPNEFGTRSVARNPLIASLLHRIDYIEKMGTGISRIRQAVAEHGGTELELRYNDFFTATFRAKTTVPTGGDIGHVTPEVTPQVTPEVRRLLSALRGDMDRSSLQAALQLKAEKNFRLLYLRPALEAGVIEMTIPDKPRSSKQKYRLTAKGRTLLQQEGQP